MKILDIDLNLTFKITRDWLNNFDHYHVESKGFYGMSFS